MLLTPRTVYSRLCTVKVAKATKPQHAMNPGMIHNVDVHVTSLSQAKDQELLPYDYNAQIHPLLKRIGIVSCTEVSSMGGICVPRSGMSSLL
ncbi:hypothetical protein Tco_1067773 [Tanacetum coccineum]|uniref:Uncharacterized protein n=1 Tax=Tanacetum coccineum TaxID=301880 RepID=A0ABQ5HDW2_9ASTR